MSEPCKTPLYQAHLDAAGKIVDFSGWLLPINYGSQIKEHEAVRSDVGMFDVSHMMITDVKGSQAKDWLRYLLANDVAKLKVVGKALYSPMLNESAGVIDDLIVYLMSEDETEYRIVSNAGTRSKDAVHFQATSQNFDVQLTQRDDLAMIAIQGPNAIQKLLQVKPDWTDVVDNLKPFQGQSMGGNWFVARTGYTGEDGVEVILDGKNAVDFFNTLKNHGVVPCGLGARDTLRMEAGMNLYGHDMDESINPLIAGMEWTIAWSDERDFIGKTALFAIKEACIPMKQVGVVLETKGVLREGMQLIIPNVGEGTLTSGTFSPTLKHAIGIARVPRDAKDHAQVDIRGALLDVRLVKLPFVRNGQKQFD